MPRMVWPTKKIWQVRIFEGDVDALNALLATGEWEPFAVTQRSPGSYTYLLRREVEVIDHSR